MLRRSFLQMAAALATAWSVGLTSAAAPPREKPKSKNVWVKLTLYPGAPVGVLAHLRSVDGVGPGLSYLPGSPTRLRFGRLVAPQPVLRYFLEAMSLGVVLYVDGVSVGFSQILECGWSSQNYCGSGTIDHGEIRVRDVSGILHDDCLGAQVGLVVELFDDQKRHTETCYIMQHDSHYPTDDL